MKKWYITFKPRGRWTRFGDRFYVANATSLDQAMKQAIDLFDRDWHNVTEENKEPDLTGLTEVEHSEIRKEAERLSRIPFKTYREKEANGKSNPKTS